MATSAVVVVGVLTIVGPRLPAWMRSADQPGASAPPIAPLILDGVWQTDVVGTAASTDSPSMGVSASSLDGTWTTDAVSAETEAAVLRAAGFDQKAFDFFMRDLGSKTSNLYTLTFDAGTFVTENAPDGASSAEIDDGSYTVEADKLVFGYPSGGATTFLWSIDGGR